MPDDVAAQLCNAFASDYCDESATDSDNWKNPGSISPDHLHVTPSAGSAVSPDDIMMYWDPPIRGDSNEIVGLYGFNEKVILRVGTFKTPVCEWVPSGGAATVRGTVTYKGNPIGGAVVSIGCKETISQIEKGFFELQVAAGRYLATAAYTDRTTGWGLNGEADTQSIAPNSSIWLPIKLEDPPPDRRQVIAKGTMDLRDAYVGGHDENTQPFFCPPLYAERVMKDIDHVEDNVLVGYTSGGASLGDTNIVVEVWLDHINGNDLSVNGHFKASMPDDNLSTGDNFLLAADETKEWDMVLDSGGSFADRATIHLNITNLRQN
jgi:hypothetical protein